MKGFQLDDGKRVLIVNLEGTLRAWDGTCTHEEADLSTGFLLADRVTCPLHLSQFDLNTGEAVTPPAKVALKSYVLRTENGDVFVDVS